MRTIAVKYPFDSSFAQEVTAAKLKLKNTSPDALARAINGLGKQETTKIRALFGLKPPTPVLIHALADLHFEAKYIVSGKPMSPPANQSPWKAAQDYVNFKPFEINQHPGKPISLRSGSASSSTLSATGSQKSVRFAEIEAQIKEFDKFAPPKDI